MNQKKTSFDSEASNNSCIEEEEIETKDQTQNTTQELNNLNLIKAVSQTLTSILENNKKLPNYKEIVKKQSKMAFSSNLIPNISLEDYLIRIQMYTNMEKSSLIISLILIDRVCQKSNLTLTYYNIHRILFSSILISIKYNEDSYYDNKYYAEIAGVKLKELKSIEYSFVDLLNFNIFIKDDIYEKYREYLDNFEI